MVLTNVFDLREAGDYKLVAKARIMKINGDGSLSLVIFPPASLMIHVGESSKANCCRVARREVAKEAKIRENLESRKSGRESIFSGYAALTGLGAFCDG